LKLQIDGGITEREGNIISASGKVVGAQANAQNRVYLESKCSPYGFCIVALALADNASLERVKQGLQSLMNSTSFKKPSNESPYKNFDWKPFLSGKILLGDNVTGREERRRSRSLLRWDISIKNNTYRNFQRPIKKISG
jgi:hypothetical protein